MIYSIYFMHELAMFSLLLESTFIQSVLINNKTPVIWKKYLLLLQSIRDNKEEIQIWRIVPRLEKELTTKKLKEETNLEDSQPVTTRSWKTKQHNVCMDKDLVSLWSSQE